MLMLYFCYNIERLLGVENGSLSSQVMRIFGEKVAVCESVRQMDAEAEQRDVRTLEQGGMGCITE
ncbi:hypothetical protein [Dehalobacterium formicoaceticum]|uniref:hypothetical protein n=1 Tax=Dehalobacterium formicoaceticum TaxID=51515 RepID=UPI0018E01532|nr:hypothetical protein [Dehalobacterium formicoaceticum]